MSVTVDSRQIVAVCTFLKKDCGFDMFTDLAGVDYPDDELRFELMYELYGIASGLHLRLKTRVSGENPEIDSVIPVWRGANWHEREAYDMYGIRFKGHPDLRRILMWEGYPYYPLRKDFPLSGLPADLPDYGRDAGRTERAAMLGGPFVSPGGTQRTLDREPQQMDTQSEGPGHG